MDFRDYLNKLEGISVDHEPMVGDIVEIELGDTLVETYIEDITEDGVVVKLDETALKLIIDARKELLESKQGVAEDEIDEAKYQGREVPLNKPMAGDVKKSKVYVKKPNGKVVKVNFGDKKMRIKKSNPKRRKSFRARHRCENPGPKWKARYWSCRAW